MTIQAVLVDGDGNLSAPAPYPDDGNGNPLPEIVVPGASPSTVARGPDVPLQNTVLASVYTLHWDQSDFTVPGSPVYYYFFTGSRVDPAQTFVPTARFRRPGA